MTDDPSHDKEVIKRLSQIMPKEGQKQKITGKRPLKSAVVGVKPVIKTKNEPVVGRNIILGA